MAGEGLSPSCLAQGRRSQAECRCAFGGPAGVTSPSPSEANSGALPAGRARTPLQAARSPQEIPGSVWPLQQRCLFLGLSKI